MYAFRQTGPEPRSPVGRPAARSRRAGLFGIYSVLIRRLFGGSFPMDTRKPGLFGNPSQPRGRERGGRVRHGAPGAGCGREERRNPDMVSVGAYVCGFPRPNQRRINTEKIPNKYRKKLAPRGPSAWTPTADGSRRGNQPDALLVAEESRIPRGTASTAPSKRRTNPGKTGKPSGQPRRWRHAWASPSRPPNDAAHGGCPDESRQPFGHLADIRSRRLSASRTAGRVTQATFASPVCACAAQGEAVIPNGCPAGSGASAMCFRLCMPICRMVRRSSLGVSRLRTPSVPFSLVRSGLR